MGHTTLFIRNEHKYSVVGEIVTSHLSCPTVPVLVLLPPEAAAFSEPGPASCRLAEDSGAACTHYHSLGVAEHSGDPKTQLLIFYNPQLSSRSLIIQTIIPRHSYIIKIPYYFNGGLLGIDYNQPVTAGTLDIHEIAVRVLDQPLKLVLPK